MTPKELDGYWKRIKTDKDIPWGYTPDCCYSRAHRMYEIARALGLSVKKVCVKPKPPATRVNPTDASGGPLRYPRGAGGASGRTVVWRYHVAIIVEVEVAGGGTQKMVIDPALFPNGPVPLDEWLDRMGGRAKLDATEYDPSVYYPGDTDATGSKTRDKLEEHAQQYISDLIKYINDNPGILDLPNPRIPAANGGVLCNVNSIAERRGDDFATVAFTSRVGKLKVFHDYWGHQTLAFLRSYGLWQEQPVVVWFDQELRAVSRAAPAKRASVLAMHDAEDHVLIDTISPTSYRLSREHERFGKLSRTARRSLKKGHDLLFVLAPTSAEVQDIVRASRFDNKRRSQRKREIRVRTEVEILETES